MTKRKIIEIDAGKCNGCGLCIPNCPEGAIQIIDGKARLVSDLFCDGLGACIGHCPRGAIQIIEREAKPYDERKVMGKIVKQGPSVIRAHLDHLKEHGEEGYLREAEAFLEEKGIDLPEGKQAKPLPCGCPGSKVMDLRGKGASSGKHGASKPVADQKSELRQWPVQLMLVPPEAPYFDGEELLVAADCVPFAHANFHRDFLKGKSLVMGCPKLDDAEYYAEKLAQILKLNKITTVTLVHMEVPCCFGLRRILEEAVKASGRGKKIRIKETVVSVDGRVKE